MKMFVIVYNSAADEDVIKAFKDAGVKEYTKMEEVYGEGSETEPKLGTHYWPGENNVLFVAAAEERIPVIIDLIKKLKKEHSRAGIKGFIMPLEECV